MRVVMDAGAGGSILSRRTPRGRRGTAATASGISSMMVSPIGPLCRRPRRWKHAADRSNAKRALDAERMLEIASRFTVGIDRMPRMRFVDGSRLRSPNVAAVDQKTKA